MIEDLELQQLVEDYLEAIREGEAEEFLDGLDDAQRERLLAVVLKEVAP